MSLEINEKMWRYSKYVDINKQSRNMKKEKKIMRLKKIVAQQSS